MRSLPAAMLAAIAFITAPAFLPMSLDSMTKSVAMIECTEYYEISRQGRAVAVCYGIGRDSTLSGLSEKSIASRRKTCLTSGCWINRYQFMPSCGGRILVALPTSDDEETPATAKLTTDTIINRSIRKAELAIANGEKRQEEMKYYLSTHSVTDEGYATVAEYASANDSTVDAVKKELAILKKLAGKQRVTIRKVCTYNLLYSADGKKLQRTPCHAVEEYKGKHAEGIVMLQTQDKFMPEEARAVYAQTLIKPSPEVGDDIIIAAFFGSREKTYRLSPTAKAKIFIGRMTGKDTHDVPQLLSPDGSPIFNSNGYFIGISQKGKALR